MSVGVFSEHSVVIISLHGLWAAALGFAVVSGIGTGLGSVRYIIGYIL